MADHGCLGSFPPHTERCSAGRIHTAVRSRERSWELSALTAVGPPPLSAPTSALEQVRTMEIEVDLPPNVATGDFVTISCGDGSCFDVEVPPGVTSKMLVTPPRQRAVVLVPQGVAAGDVFIVQSAYGDFEVECPQEMGAGDELLVDLPDEPTATAHPPHALPLQPDAAAATPCASATQPELTSRIPGDPRRRRCKVLRSNGSWSPAVVVDHDDLSGTYTVQLEQGALKHMVEEGEMAELDHTPTTVGAHYEGRRVQIRASGNASAWEEAIVRAFEAPTRTYVVEMVRTSQLRHGVRRDDIRIRTSL